MNLRRCLSSLALLLLGGSVVVARGGSRQGFTGNASAAFEILSGQASVSYLGKLEFFEAIVAKQGLSRKDGGNVFGQSWARWEAENQTGRVVAFAAFPETPDKKNDRFWVSYEPAEEQPMPQAVLSHLLGKADETLISSGNTFEVKFSAHDSISKCLHTNTLRIRMTTGALVLNTVEYYCPVAAASQH
jgi:hypothetical protein